MESGQRVFVAVFVVAMIVAVVAAWVVNRDDTVMTPEPKGFALNIPSNLTQEAKDLLSAAWPKVRAAAPGLDKYASVLQFVEIDASYLQMKDKEYQRVTVEILCPKGQSVIPPSYRAWGHHCFLDISRDGSTLTIAKTPCQSVCLDREVTGDHDPLVLSLVTPGRIVEETEEQYARSARKVVFREGDTGVFHKELLKNPNKFRRARLIFTGKIMAVEETGGQTFIQVYINRNYDTVLIAYPGTLPIYKGDYIRVLGEGAGTFSGNNMMGASMTWPLIKAKFVTKIRSGDDE